jgi:hypothetical protein
MPKHDSKGRRDDLRPLLSVAAKRGTCKWGLRQNPSAAPAAVAQ